MKFELHSLYIDKFRNLNRQLVNLTGRFHIAVSGHKVVITEHKVKYKSNFFGDNIFNLSAIIGKNGSGKSNILEFINYMLFTPKSVESTFVYIVDANLGIMHNGLLVITNNTQLKFEFNVHESCEVVYTDEVDYKELSTIYFSNVNDGNKSKLPRQTIDLTSNNNPSGIRGRQDYLLAEFKFFQSGLNKEFGVDTPQFIQARTNVQSGYFYQRKLGDYNPTPLHDYRKRLTKGTTQKSFFHRLIYFIVIDCIILIAPSKEEDNRSFDLFDSKDPRVTELIEIIDGLDKFKDIRDMYEYLLRRMEAFAGRSQDFIHLSRLIDHIISLDKESDFEFEREGKRLTRLDTYLFPFESKYVDFIIAIENYFVRAKHIAFSIHGLSSGHRAFLNLYSRLLSVTGKRLGKNLLIIIDEGELYFHPQWQKEYVQKILNFVSSTFHNRYVQIIITSHSPFVVSDLPKSNIVFLGERKAGHIADTVFETFGANILDLFDNSFFLDGALSGDFSAKKTEEVLNDLSDFLKGVSKTPVPYDLIGNNVIRAQIEALLSKKMK